MPKAQRISPARTATEKARKAALAEIQQRLDTPLAPDAAHVAPTGELAPEGAVTAKAGSPRPPKPTSGGKGKKGAKAKPAKTPKAAKEPKSVKAAKPERPKRLSCLDAAAQVLSASKEPMKAKEMIEAMAKKNLWSSPKGKTPEASLYAAVIREIAAKGVDARFVKTDRGTFAAAGKGR
jgi:hypothetical protein